MPMIHYINKLRDSIINMHLKASFIFLLIFLVIFLPLGSSVVQTLGTVKKDSCVELIQGCANCSFNNISSIIYPNSTIALTNKVMTRDGANFNYTFCDTAALGEYIVLGFGDEYNIPSSWTYNFFVTTSGNSAEDNMFLLIILIVVGVVILLVAYMSENEWLGFIAGVIFIMSGIRVLIYGLGNISNLYSWALGFVLIGLGLLFEVAAGFKVIEGGKTFPSDD